MTELEAKKCMEEWERIEMSDLEPVHLRREREKLYLKWFVKLLAHVRENPKSVNRDKP